MISTLGIMQADFKTALQNKANGQKHSADDSLLNATVLADRVAAEPAYKTELDEVQISRIIEMAWEDRTTFAAIKRTYGLSESEVIKLMRREMQPSSFKMWRKRVKGRATKHVAKRSFEVGRAYCKAQYKHR